MPRFLNVDDFGDRLAVLQADIRDERRIPTCVADGLCAQLGGVLREVRVSVTAPDRQRVRPDLDEAVLQARQMGGADPFGRVTR